ncbi:3-oxoacyl-ACP reductase FabG [Ruminococcaceae bacterium OttesenSCG-928-D13]|nr:3-oxoacyl-ACP reductase FabG [Ruminococcaceae bacterium OttesenSCG-928-D13]
MSRTVLVTGASGGIGAAVATAFALSGDRVVLGAFNHMGRAQALCNRLADDHHTVLAVAADVGDEAQVAAMFERAEAVFGPVEVLVNCAGTAAQKLFTDISLAEWEAMLRVHATGTFLCCRRALGPMIRKKSGCIVNIASMWGQVGASCEVHYSAAKAAVIGLTKALAKEVGPSGIRVNCVAPGAVDTEMMAGFSADDRAALCAETPLGRLGTPGEIAAAVQFLVSEKAGFITGQVLAPNGGLVI